MSLDTMMVDTEVEVTLETRVHPTTTMEGEVMVATDTATTRVVARLTTQTTTLLTETKETKGEMWVG